MDALAPFAKVLGWGPVTETFASVLLGFGFGFCLESAGFGNAKVLAGQWYGYNFAVIRVMFTAVVVAMLGLFGLSYLGVLDLEQVYINETYLWPQLAGGVLFGVGFVTANYCPGTAFTACATGKLDGMTYVVGFFLGITGFSFAFPLVSRFYESSPMGRVLLSDVFGVPTGVVVLGIVAMALGAFLVTHVIEKKLAKPA